LIDLLFLLLLASVLDSALDSAFVGLPFRALRVSQWVTELQAGKDEANFRPLSVEKRFISQERGKLKVQVSKDDVRYSRYVAQRKK
jgi:hypothetical protein